MYSCVVEYFCGETDRGLWHAENKHGPGNPRDGQCPHDWQGRQGNQFVYIMLTIMTTSNQISYISKQFRTSIWFCIVVLQKLAEALSENKTLKVLNVESNFISGESIVELMKAINKNQALQELRVANQVRCL